MSNLFYLLCTSSGTRLYSSRIQYICVKKLRVMAAAINCWNWFIISTAWNLNLDHSGLRSTCVHAQNCLFFDSFYLVRDFTILTVSVQKEN